MRRREPGPFGAARPRRQPPQRRPDMLHRQELALVAEHPRVVPVCHEMIPERMIDLLLSGEAAAHAVATALVIPPTPPSP